MKDPYLILGLPTEAERLSDQQVKSAYLRLVQQYPHDRYPEHFQAIRAAYEQLEDDNKRLQYRLFDTTLADRNDFIAVLFSDNTDGINNKVKRPNLAVIQHILKNRK